MKIAYFDCTSGISGDMTLGALVDAGVPLDAIQDGVSSLGLKDCRLVASEVIKHGFRATQIKVEHPPEHAHRQLHHITEMIDGSQLTPAQQLLATRIFTRLAEAEAKVHGTTIEKVHFHEVGAVDSIADIVGAAIGWDLLGAERLVCSPVPTGGGVIEIAHGRCGVPAPATAELLRGIPLAECDIQAELTTPTGAAIIATLADAFGAPPAMSISSIGFGAGERDLKEQANVLRLLVGEASDQSTDSERLCMLETNLDDVTGEIIGHTSGLLLEAGALDVFTIAIQMKKNRPGALLSVLCRLADAQRLEDILFCETGTLGVRRTDVARRAVERLAHRVTTRWGEVAGVVAKLPGGKRAFSPEYEDCRRVAGEHNVPLGAVYQAAQAAFEPDESGDA